MVDIRLSSGQQLFQFGEGAFGGSLVCLQNRQRSFAELLTFQRIGQQAEQHGLEFVLIAHHQDSATIGELLHDVAKVFGVRSNDDWQAETSRLQDIMSALRGQAAADKGNVS